MIDNTIGETFDNEPKIGKRERNAILRIVGLVIELRNMNLPDDYYDIEIDSRTGIVLVKKWKRRRLSGEYDIDIVHTMWWKPGVYQARNGYVTLKEIQRWLESEKAVHTEADLSPGKEQKK